jgi:hypothetical protein
MANYANYKEGFDYENFPAVKLAKGYEVVLEHGDTLYMPAGYLASYGIHRGWLCHEFHGLCKAALEAN